MMNFIERLQYYMTQKGINDNKLTVDAGLSVGLIGKAKKMGKAMNSANIEKILLAYPDLSAEWLLTGKGEMLKTKNTPDSHPLPKTPLSLGKDTKKSSISQEKTNPFEELVLPSKRSPRALPLVSVKAVGGLSGKDFAINEQDVEGYYVIPKFRHLGVDFLIEVIGDSMMPRLFPGDIIACSIVHNPSYIQWNKTYLIGTLYDGMIVKRLKKSSKEDCYLAVSDNENYDPFDLPKEEITSLARVVGVIHVE